MTPKTFGWLALCLICAASLIEECVGKTECIRKSKECADRRINSHKGTGKRDLLQVFQDAIYQYCLELYGCEEGKKSVCRRVGISERSYTDKDIRTNLINKCRRWKVSIVYVREELTGHYINIDRIND
ncbi:unnamed protein product [Orchesella dallaii]|uniref:Uncharacterized protein n=1 Tax=Orchesella dallaii TaxID=48710 RepID=A0ABP1R2K9_9HEXA